MNDVEFKDHLRSLTTSRMAMLMHAYKEELNRRAAWATPKRTSELVGQDASLRAVMAAAISKQSLLLLGPPKCGKTMLREIAQANSPHTVIAELQDGRRSTCRYDGAIRMRPVNLDALMFAETREVPEGVIWSKSLWSPVLDIDSLALEWLESIGLPPKDQDRAKAWASALAALDRARPAGMSHVREAVEMVKLVWSVI